MSYRETDIVHENPSHWVLKVPKGFEVYRFGLTHSTRVAQIGAGLSDALARAIAEADKRHAAHTR